MISVFGGTGFIGSRFCEMYPDETIKIPRAQRCPESNTILYLISTTHNYNALSVDVETNLRVLSEVLEQLEPGDEFNFVSSWFVYNAKGNYSFTKRLAEELVRFYCQSNDITYRIFRLGNVFGKGDKYSKQKNALQYLINELREDRDIGLYYGGQFLRNYIWVDDVCKLIMDFMGINDGYTLYDIGSQSSVLFRNLILLAKETLRSNSSIMSKTDIPELHKKVQTKNFEFPNLDHRAYFPLLPSADTIPTKLVRMILDES